MKPDKINTAEEYRIPTADEFVQGFKFQVKKAGSFGILDFSETPPKSEHFSDWEIWQDAVVTWKLPSGERVKFTQDGIDYDMPSDFLNFINQPFDVQSFIDQGLIRVKIEK